MWIFANVCKRYYFASLASWQLSLMSWRYNSHNDVFQWITYTCTEPVLHESSCSFTFTKYFCDFIFYHYVRKARTCSLWVLWSLYHKNAYYNGLLLSFINTQSLILELLVFTSELFLNKILAPHLLFLIWREHSQTRCQEEWVMDWCPCASWVRLQWKLNKKRLQLLKKSNTPYLNFVLSVFCHLSWICITNFAENEQGTSLF